MSEIHERLARVTAAVSHIAKQTSSGVSYEFRSIDAVMNHLHQHLADEGIVLSPRVRDDWQLNMIPGTNNRVQSQALFRIDVYAMAPDGTEAKLGTGLAQSHDYGDKAVYQASQNAIKYVLLNAFSIPTGEPDMDARQPDAIPTEHQQLLDELEALLDTAAQTDGVDGDPDKARAYARQSKAHAEKAIATVRDKLAAATDPAGPDGGEGGGSDHPSDRAAKVEEAFQREGVDYDPEAFAAYLGEQFSTSDVAKLADDEWFPVASNLHSKSWLQKAIRDGVDVLERSKPSESMEDAKKAGVG